MSHDITMLSLVAYDILNTKFWALFLFHPFHLYSYSFSLFIRLGTCISELRLNICENKLTNILLLSRIMDKENNSKNNDAAQAQLKKNIILRDKRVCKPSTREKSKKLCDETHYRRKTPLGDIIPNIISQRSKINNHINQVCTQPSHTYNYFQSHRCTTIMHLAGVNLMPRFDSSNVNNSTTNYTEKTCNLVEDLSNLNYSTSTLRSSEWTTNTIFFRWKHWSWCR